jgi:hypothetical protein
MIIRGREIARFVVLMVVLRAAPVVAQDRPRPATSGRTQTKQSLVLATVTKEYAKDTQPHPGAAYRVDKLRPGKWGDTRVTESVAGHAVIYAKQRYAIADIVSDADYERASKEMYDYLSWRYGNPAAVAAQWISAGYQHFDSFAAEAAAALMGMDLPGPGEVIRLPKEVSTWLKAQVDSMRKDPNYTPCIEVKQAGAAPNAEVSSDPVVILVGAGCDVLIRLAADAAKQAIERIGISAAVFDARRFNISDSSAEFMILLKRNPPLSLRASVRPARIVAVGEGGAQ